MTDRYNALTVVLDRDMRDADAEVVIQAIRMIKFVQAVTPHVSNISDYVAEVRVRLDIEERLYRALREKP